MEYAPLILIGIVIAGFVALFVARSRKPAKSTIDLELKWQELHDEILATSKLVAARCPANETAHKHLIQASMCLVFPNGYGGPYRIIGAEDIIRRYDEGFEQVLKARRIAENT